MMIATKELAPGCFGAASVYGMDSKACQSCVAFADCGKVSEETLQRLCETINVKDMLARHERAKKASSKVIESSLLPSEVSPIPVAQPKPINGEVERETDVLTIKFEVSAGDEMTIAKIGNSHAKNLAISLCKQNKIDRARAELSKGNNPFSEGGRAFLRIACDLLLSGGFTKSSIRSEFIKQLSWKDGTAGPHVAICCALFSAFNIVKETPQGFVLHPSVVCQNNVLKN